MAGLIRRDDFGVLRDRSFLRVYLARTTSVLGNGIAPIALAFAVLAMPGGSALKLGLVLLVRQLAQIVFLLLGGVIADRLPRNKVMVSSDLMAALGQLGIATLFIAHTSRLWPILVLSVVTGAAPALFIPASTGLMPQVVPKTQLQSANALMRFSMNSSMIFGAAIAGVLVATVGAGWALAADSLTFGVSAALLLGVRIPDASKLPKASIIGDLRHGWREFSSRQWVWVIVLQFSISNACYNGGINVLGPLIAQTHLGGVGTWVAFSVARAVGLVAGSTVAMRIRPRFPLRTALYATFGFVPAFFALAFFAPVWALAGTAILIGVCLDIFSVLWDTSLQTHVPQQSLSKVSAYDALGSVALGPLGLAVAGPAAAMFGLTETLVAGGILTAAVNAAALASPSVRNLRATADPAPEAPPQPEPPPGADGLALPDLDPASV
jgi:predicted MFS family arabinose efflux permease